MKTWATAVAGLACAFGAAAQAPVEAAAAADGGRQAAFGALKYRMLEAQAGIDAVLHPPGDMPDGDPRVYFGSDASSFELRHVGVSIDGGPLAERGLETDEARALAGTGELLWLEPAFLPDGPHRVHALVQAMDSGKPEAGMQTFEADAQVDFDQAGAALEFSLAGSGLLGAAHLDVREHRAHPAPHGWLRRALEGIAGVAQPDGGFVTGGGTDPRVRHAAWLTRLQRYDAAAVELLAVRQETQDAALPDSFWLTLAAALRQAHLPDQAAAICDRLDAAGAERQAVGVERLRLGLLQYRYGNAAEAERQLLSARGRLPQDRVQDWQVAYAQLQFDRNQYAAALRTLQDGNVETIDAYRYMDQSTEAVRTSTFRRYNLAVAMVHEGDQAHGLSLLDLVGRLKTSDGDLLTLRDKANLTLGWHFLRDKQGATAMGILGRVRSEGRLSDRALLGMGWAQLQPGDKKFERTRLSSDTEDPLNPLPAPVRNSLVQLGVLEPETRGEVGPRNFTRERPAATREEAMRRALTFWSYLAGHDAREPAVQESLLAIAYAYDSLGDTQHAREAYGKAIAALEARKLALAADEDLIGGGDLPGRIDSAGGDAALSRLMDGLDLPPDDAATALYVSLDRYQDLGRLERRFTELRPALALRSGASDPAPLLADLGSARKAEAANLEALARERLERQKVGIDDYLKLAYFAAARTEDASLDRGSLN